MEHIMGNKDITVLLVSNNESDIDSVKNHLGEIMGLSCHVRHCAALADAVALFGEDRPEIDIVLLDLNLIGSDLPRAIFLQMGSIVGTVPIIVFTEKDDHELALLLIEDGAADNVTRGQFSTDPYKLRDAIEFSLARNDISNKSKRKSAKALDRLGKRGAADLKTQQEHSDTDMKAAKKDAALVLKKAGDESRKNLKEKDETIFWMGGGYSVKNTSDKP